MATDTIANRHRPKKFSDVVGQEKEVEVLKRIVAGNWQPNAVMLTGPFGTGKTTLARLLTRAMHCDNRQLDEDGVFCEPCGKCITCKAMDDDNNPHYIEVDAASQGAVSDVRGMKDLLSYRTGSKRRVICYDESHMLSAAAQNALLQTLEEGSDDVLFVFCVDGEELIQTKEAVRRLKDVRVGEEVLTHEGWKPVKGKYAKGKKSTIRLTTAGGNSVALTPEHKVLTDKGWMRADQTLGKAVKLAQGAKAISLEGSPEAEFLGRLVGDGFWRKNNDSFSVGILFRNDELEKGLGLLEKAGVEINSMKEKGKITEISLKDGPALMERFGLKPYERGAKSLPEVVTSYSRDQLHDFFEGWYGADGYSNTSGRTQTPVRHLYSSNIKLLREAKVLLSHLGRTTTLGITERKHEGDNPNVGIKAGVYIAGDLWTRQKPRDFDEVISIEDAGEVEVYDLEVPGPASFNAGGVIVHNCTTESNKMLPTVQSRCIVLNMRLLTPGQIRERLEVVAQSEGVEYDIKALRIVATHVRGHARDALVMFEQLSRMAPKIEEGLVRSYLRLDRHVEVYKFLTQTEPSEGLETLENLLCNYAPTELTQTVGEILVNAYKVAHGTGDFTDVDKAWLQKVIEARGVDSLLDSAEAILSLKTDYATIDYGIASLGRILFEGKADRAAGPASSIKPGGAPAPAAIPGGRRKPGK